MEATFTHRSGRPWQPSPHRIREKGKVVPRYIGSEAAPVDVVFFRADTGASNCRTFCGGFRL